MNVSAYIDIDDAIGAPGRQRVVLRIEGLVFLGVTLITTTKPGLLKYGERP